MDEALTLAAIAGGVLLYGLVSGRLQNTIITAPMVIVILGIGIGTQGLGLIDLAIEHAFVNIVAEITLVLVLFADASRISLKRLSKQHVIPTRLLAIGLPLTMIAGTLVGMLIFSTITIWSLIILAIILSPTDAALGQAVVSSPRVPVRIRQAINVESGLNDGIALPFLLFFMSMAGEAESANPGYWIRFGAAQIILGPIAGIAVGFIGGKLVSWSESKGWMTEVYQKLVAISLALLAYSVAELIGGNGFIAAFVAGIVLGNYFRDACGRMSEYLEAESHLFMVLTFLLYGAIMVMPALDMFNWQIGLYAVLSLTIVRMVPVAISLIGVKLQTRTILFLGWFGPRGIASIIYGLIVLEEFGLRDSDEILAIVMTTVFLSIFAHGLSAVPSANHYGAHIDEMADDDMPENTPVTEMPVRHPWEEGVAT